MLSGRVAGAPREHPLTPSPDRGLSIRGPEHETTLPNPNHGGDRSLAGMASRVETALGARLHERPVRPSDILEAGIQIGWDLSDVRHSAWSAGVPIAVDLVVAPRARTGRGLRHQLSRPSTSSVGKRRSIFGRDSRRYRAGSPLVPEPATFRALTSRSGSHDA